MTSTDNETWDVVITAKRKWLGLDIKELRQYKDLVNLMIRREFVSVYKQTIFGPLWFIFQPLLSTFLYMFVFGNIAQMGTDSIPQPLFYFSGTMLWTFFATTLQKARIPSSTTRGCSEGLLSALHHADRLCCQRVFHTSDPVCRHDDFLHLLHSTGIILQSTGGCSLHRFTSSSWGCLGIGFGIMISALTTKYHDLRNLVSFGLSLLMYATPVVYPVSSIPIKWKLLFQLNPVTPALEMFRYSLFGKGSCDLNMWVFSLIVSVIVFLLGLMIFNHNEQTFVDVI